MRYPYSCRDCEHKWDVVKSVKDIDQAETCPACSSQSNNRYIASFYFNGASDWDKAEYNPGLGCVVRNAQHRKELAKQRGLEEIGNDFSSADAVHKHYETEKQRQLDATWERI